MDLPQISLFDYIESCKPKPKQLLQVGETIWVVTIGDVERNVVEQVFDCKNQNGYYIKHGTVWDRSVDDYVFKVEADAVRKAQENLQGVKYILADDIHLTKQRTFYNGRIYATVGMVGDKMVYDGQFMLYRFLKVFKTSDEADKYYKDALNKITTGEVHNDRTIELSEQEKPVNMYWTKDFYGPAKYANFGNRY